MSICDNSESFMWVTRVEGPNPRLAQISLGALTDILVHKSVPLLQNQIVGVHFCVYVRHPRKARCAANFSVQVNSIYRSATVKFRGKLERSILGFSVYTWIPHEI